jgi:serine/threonine protein kinase
LLGVFPQVSGDWWFITQFCAHGDLFGAILPLQGVCDENRTKKYFAQLVDAVAYLHDADIVHRDIKPENCLLTADDDLKLCDFGLSGFESDEWETGIGTFPYVLLLPLFAAMLCTCLLIRGLSGLGGLRGLVPSEAPALASPSA